MTWLLRDRPTGKFVFLPELPEAVVREPVSQLLKLKPLDMCPATHAVGHQHIRWIEVVQQQVRQPGLLMADSFLAGEKG